MKQQMQKGFTLIELMIVIAIIGILAAVALPAYQDYTVRSKISEAIVAATAPKVLVSEAFVTDGLPGVTAGANEYNLRPIAEKQSKFIANVVISNADGSITITLGAGGTTGLPADAAGTTLVFTPNVNVALLGGANGAVDWACASVTNATATTRGLVVAANGTLPAKYAPSECR